MAANIAGGQASSDIADPTKPLPWHVSLKKPATHQVTTLYKIGRSPLRKVKSTH